MMNALLDELEGRLGAQGLLRQDISARHAQDWSAEPGLLPGAVLRPVSTQEVAAALRLCNDYGQPLVIQGGLTGLSGGAVPRAGELALSLERLSGVEEIDAASMTMTVKAGTPLQVVQQAAEAAGFVFPLDLGARGSCNIGGNLSTNAGGNQVLRFGMARALVLGLEVVLADGSVISSLNKMLKNNAGYDLKQLFIGTEGTLGVITRAVLRLYPQPRSRCSALLALESFEQVVGLLHFLSRELGGSMSAFEAMWASYYHFICDRVDKAASPFAERHPLYLLTEMEGGDPERDQEKFEAILGRALEEGLALDATVARSERERAGFWQIRDGVGEIGSFLRSGVANFDVSVPISAMPVFLDDIERELRGAWPDLTMLVFGHIADSNLHIICGSGRREDVKSIYDIVYQTVGRHHGSVSAEHGIGVQKKPYLPLSRTPEELALMRRLKLALDPKAILNPGRVVDPYQGSDTFSSAR